MIGSKAFLFSISLTALLLSSADNVTAQTDWRQMDLEAVYKLARENAFAKRYEKAEEMLLYVLEKNPKYDDARTLLGRTYAWRSEYEKARKEFSVVLQNHKDDHEALDALTDVEWWDNKFKDLLTQSEIALKSYPSDERFMLKKARALHSLQDDNRAMVTLNQLITLNPANAEATTLLKEIKSNRLKYTVAVFYSHDSFHKYFTGANYSSLQVARVSQWGTGVLRENFASRFDRRGFQTELDIYPKVTKNSYAYLNYGYSSTVLFPAHRMGAELFVKLPAHLELSAGMRYLFFNRTSEVTMYTGSLGWYVKNWWIAYRQYFTPGATKGAGLTYQFLARLYYKNNRDDYWGFRYSLGYSPDERRLQSTNGYTPESIYNLRSGFFAVDWSKNLPRNFIINVTASIAYQEFLFLEKERVGITSFTAGLKKRF